MSAAKALKNLASSLKEGVRVEGTRSTLYFSFIHSLMQKTDGSQLETWQDENGSRRNGLDASQTSLSSMVSSGSRDSVLSYVSTSFNPIEDLLPDLCSKTTSSSLGVGVVDLLKIILLDLDSDDPDTLLGCIVLFTWLLSKQWRLSDRMVSVADFQPKDVKEGLYKVLLKCKTALRNCEKNKDYVRFALFLLSNQHAESAVQSYKSLITDLLLECLSCFQDDCLATTIDSSYSGKDERFVSTLALRALVRVCRQPSMSLFVFQKLSERQWTAVLRITANHLEIRAEGETADADVLGSACWLMRHAPNREQMLQSVVESGWLTECAQRVTHSVVNCIKAGGKKNCDRVKQWLQLLAAVGTLADGRTCERWVLGYIVEPQRNINAYGLAWCLQSIRRSCSLELDWYSCVVQLAETACRVPWDGDDKHFKMTVRALLQLVEPTLTDDDEVLINADPVVAKCAGRVMVALAGWPGARGAAFNITARSDVTHEKGTEQTAKGVVSALASFGCSWEASRGMSETDAMLRASCAHVAGDALLALASSTTGDCPNPAKARARWDEGLRWVRLVLSYIRRLIDGGGAPAGCSAAVKDELSSAEWALHCAFWSLASSIVAFASHVAEASIAELLAAITEWYWLDDIFLPSMAGEDSAHLEAKSLSWRLVRGVTLDGVRHTSRVIADFLLRARDGGARLSAVLEMAEHAAKMVSGTLASRQNHSPLQIGLALGASPAADPACAMGTQDSAYGKRLLIGELRGERGSKRACSARGSEGGNSQRSGRESVRADAVTFTQTQVEDTQTQDTQHMFVYDDFQEPEDEFVNRDGEISQAAEQAQEEETELPPNGTFQPPQQDTHNTARTASTELVNTYAEANGGVANTYNDSNQVFETNNQLYSLKHHVPSPNLQHSTSATSAAAYCSLDSHLSVVQREVPGLGDREQVFQLLRRVAQLQAELAERLYQL